MLKAQTGSFALASTNFLTHDFSERFLRSSPDSGEKSMFPRQSVRAHPALHCAPNRFYRLSQLWVINTVWVVLITEMLLCLGILL